MLRMHVGPRGWGLSGHLVTGCNSQFYRPRASEVPAEAGQPARTSFAFPNLAKASQECCWPLGLCWETAEATRGEGWHSFVLFCLLGWGKGLASAKLQTGLL